MLPGVLKEVRMSLIRQAVQSKAASFDFAKDYWAHPAIHATLDGDTTMLAWTK